MTPNYDAAAIKATETLIKHRISFAPISSMPILKSTPGAFVLSFEEFAARMSLNRQNIVETFSEKNRDAVTTVCSIGGKLRYIVAYNQRLPFYMLQRALARELGHIVLEHDGSRPEDVREEEALCFARHLLCPRPLIRAIQDTGASITVEAIGNITGCYARCIAGLQKTPGANVPAELNRAVRVQFADYVSNYRDCQSIMDKDDESALVDFGSYMDNYHE